MLGLNRLTSDLQRAGFMSSPNVQIDPATCGNAAFIATWPVGMREIASVAIIQGGSTLAHLGQLNQSVVGNDLNPDSIVVAGNLSTTEQFLFKTIQCGAGGCAVYIDELSGAVQRTLLREAGGGDSLLEIFAPGRVLRLLISGDNKYMYGVINHTDVIGSPVSSIVVHLETTPALPQKTSYGCGLPDATGDGGQGGIANPISRVRYDLRSLAGHASYGPLVAPINDAVTGDNGRTELVRVELDTLDAEIPSTLELIAEYAVDLKFGITRQTPDPIVSRNNPTITRFPITSPDNTSVYTIAATNTNVGAEPQHIVAIQVRLSTRTRAPDREVGYPPGLDGRRQRFRLFGAATNPVPLGSPPLFARMRTLYADVALPNLKGVTW
jgi:hypothetical protein